MTVVLPPFLLDFGKTRIGSHPVYFYDPRKMAQAEAQWRDLFGSNWDQVAGALYELRVRFDIHYLDPRPGNINCGDGLDDLDDWEKEPGVNYSEYD